MHILPQGYTRSRSYGGFHCVKRRKYLDECRRLLQIEPSTEDEPPKQQPQQETSLPKCPRCQVEMKCIDASPRPSWQEVFTKLVYEDSVYCPLLHMGFGVPEAFSIGGYG